MVFAIVFVVNAAGNFLLGIVLGAMLGPAEFGRFATVALAATTLATAFFDWLRLSSLRFSGDERARIDIAASLDAAYLAMMALAVAGVGICALAQIDFGLGLTLLALLPLLAIANARCDYSGALLRARNQANAFAALYALRHVLTFSVVVGAAYCTRSVGVVIAALAATSLAPVVALGGRMRTPGASVGAATRQRVGQFAAYAKPIVVSTVVYQLIGLINRHSAIDLFGLAATGKLALATDLGFRLFLAINVMPETLLFQYALARERREGRAAAQRQIGVNSTMVLALLAPLTAGYMAMAPTFEALIAPAAYRGDFATLSLALAPGFLAFCALYSMLNPVFQLAGRTWPLTIAAGCALASDLAMINLPAFRASVEGLALAHSLSLCVGFSVAAIPALRARAVRPAGRDLCVVAAATLAMALAIRPLNGLASPLAAAALALLIGGAIIGAAILAFDVAGLRAMLLQARAAPANAATPLAGQGL